MKKDWSGFDQAAAKFGNFVAKRLFRIMILPVKLSGLKRWWKSNEAVSRRPPAGISHKTLEKCKGKEGLGGSKKINSI